MTNWVAARNFSIATFVITAFMLTFGKNIFGASIASSQIMHSGITWLYLVAGIQIFLAVLFWKEYFGKGGWYTQRKTLVVLSLISTFILFGKAL